VPDGPRTFPDSPAMQPGQCPATSRPTRRCGRHRPAPAQRGAGPADRQRLGDVQRQLPGERRRSLTGVPGVTLIVRPATPFALRHQRRARPLCRRVPLTRTSPARPPMSNHICSARSIVGLVAEPAITTGWRRAPRTYPGSTFRCCRRRSTRTIPASIRSGRTLAISPPLRIDLAHSCPTPAMCSCRQRHP